MKILGIETTGSPSSVSLLDGDKNLGEFTLNSKMNHSETIMPLIKSLLEMLHIAASEVDYIACSGGPGSFTGLRIGASTAKAIGHGLNKKMVMVPTLDALAYNILESSRFIVPVMDARRGQVYTAVYKNETGKGMKRLTEYMAADMQELLDTLKKSYGEAVFLGDGIYAYKNAIIEQGHCIAPSNMNMQRAASVAYCAKMLIEEGCTTDYNNFELMYLRKPQAEREYEEKLKND